MVAGAADNWEDKTQATSEFQTAGVRSTAVDGAAAGPDGDPNVDGRIPRRVPVIVTLRGNVERKPYVLSTAHTDIGRSPQAAISIDDPKTSRQHARIIWESVDAPAEYPRCVLEDQGSHNGTYLNHRRVSNEQLADGDRIIVGTTVLGFYIREALDSQGAENVLVRMGTHDSLTGLSSRLHFEEQVQRYTSLARRHQRPVCLSLLEVDSFNALNQRAGHVVGDSVLRLVADVIRLTLRLTDFAARTEGDRFAVLWPETGLKEAIVATERLRCAVSAKSLTLRGEPLVLSLSGGVVQLSARHSTWRGLYDEANMVVMTARRSGGDRVVSAPTD
jgi:two-component system, cell cycle response regulator